LAFKGLAPRSSLFNEHLQAAKITKVDAQGRVVDFHSLRHTFCTNLHHAGVSQREAMQSAVQKIGFSPSPTASSFLGAEGHLPSSPITKPASVKSDKRPVNKGEMSLFDAACLVLSNIQRWCAIQVSNL
jgi:hypothetical protein